MAVLHLLDKVPNSDLYQILLRLQDWDSAVDTSLASITNTTAGLITYINALSLHEVDKQARDRLVVKLQALIDAGLLTDAEVAAAVAASGGSRYTTLLAAASTDDATLTDTFATRLPGE